jgi:hypothetical protein
LWTRDFVSSEITYVRLEIAGESGSAVGLLDSLSVSDGVTLTFQEYVTRWEESYDLSFISVIWRGGSGEILLLRCSDGGDICDAYRVEGIGDVAVWLGGLPVVEFDYDRHKRKLSSCCYYDDLKSDLCTYRADRFAGPYVSAVGGSSIYVLSPD